MTDAYQRTLELAIAAAHDRLDTAIARRNRDAATWALTEITDIVMPRATTPFRRVELISANPHVAYRWVGADGVMTLSVEIVGWRTPRVTVWRRGRDRDELLYREDGPVVMVMNRALRHVTVP